MAIYAIGDIQGCYADLRRLLKKINFDAAKDTLWFVGDLVNRGPDSLASLRYVRSLGKSAISVLGNHDLHLLAVHSGIQPISPKNDLYAILEAPDSDELIDWLRRRPLIHHDDNVNFTMVHAGIFPLWNLQTAITLASEAEHHLQSDDYVRLLKNMYGDTPDDWEQISGDWSRLRFIINAFTRMRYCDERGRMNLTEKGPPGTQTQGLMPWFRIPNRQKLNSTIVFGHWSAMGLVNTKEVLGLDTGCVWGGSLTAARLDSDSPVMVSIECDEYQSVQGKT